MLVCDRLSVDPLTKKKNLDGIFDIIYYSKLPVLIQQMWVYINLSDVTDDRVTRIELMNFENNTLLAEMRGTLKAGKNLTWELGYCFKNILLKEPGMHAFRFWIDDFILAEKYIHLKRGGK